VDYIELAAMPCARRQAGSAHCRSVHYRFPVTAHRSGDQAVETLKFANDTGVECGSSPTKGSGLRLCHRHHASLAR
jgi:hypothetical protein